VSPFAKVLSISSVYFPQFNQAILELDAATIHYRLWMQDTRQKQIRNLPTADPPDGLGCFEDALRLYTRKRNELLDALKKFASGEFQ
jgi:hypothetical protein